MQIETKTLGRGISALAGTARIQVARIHSTLLTRHRTQIYADLIIRSNPEEGGDGEL